MFCSVLRHTPCAARSARYVSAFKSGFDAGLGAVQLLFMQSDGGLAPANDFSGHKAILSGPAGAAVAAALSVCAQQGRAWVALAPAVWRITQSGITRCCYGLPAARLAWQAAHNAVQQLHRVA
jgi:hypothetical protein